MNLEQLGKWVESVQYRKILNILEQAPSVVQQLRQFGILDKGTVEELQSSIEQGALAFEQEGAETSGKYTTFIREGGKILAQIPWEKLTVNINIVSVSTLAISLHNAIMLHKISAQLMKIDAKLDSILLGQQTDREADCKSAMSLLEQAKLYNGKDDELKKNLISNALQSATRGYEAILPYYSQTIEKMARAIVLRYILDHPEIYNDPFTSFGLKCFNSGVGKFGAKLISLFMPEDEGKQFVVDMANSSAAEVNSEIKSFHQQWNYLYLGASVVVFSHLLQENQRAANRMIVKFYQEVLQPVSFPDAEEIDEIEDEDEQLAWVPLLKNKEYMEVYNQHIEQFNILDELYVKDINKEK